MIGSTWSFKELAELFSIAIPKTFAVIHDRNKRYVVTFGSCERPHKLQRGRAKAHLHREYSSDGVTHLLHQICVTWIAAQRIEIRVDLDVEKPAVPDLPSAL